MRDPFTLREAIPLLERTYKSMDIRALIAKERGQWLCIFLKIRLTDEDQTRVEDVHKKQINDLAVEKSDNCLLVAEWRNIIQFDSIIEEIRHGRITIQGISSQLRAHMLGNFQETEIQRYPAYSKPEEMLGYKHWFVFIPNDGSVSTWKKVTDLELKREDLPIELELMGDWFDIPSSTWNSNINYIIMIMPIYIKRLSVPYNDLTKLSIKYVIHPELDEKIRCRITYLNEEHYKVENHQLKEFQQDQSIDNRIVVIIPVNANYILQDGEIEIQISREPLGILFSDRIDTQDLKPRSANYIQELILDNAKKFSQSVQKLLFKNVDPFEYYIYQLISISFPCIWIGLFEGDWQRIFEDEGISHTVDFILNTPKSVLLIECTRQYTADRSVVGVVELKKLLHVKEKLEAHGLGVYAVLICNEYYKSNSQFFNSEFERYRNVHFIFNEGMEMIQSQIHLMTDYKQLLVFQA
jgi:hypothetical protein